MKVNSRIAFFLCLFVIAGTYADAQTDKFEYSFSTAHPKAKLLMADAFYWNPMEETAPFGSDDGFDAAYGFRTWRMSHKTSHSIDYLRELIARWNYSPFDWNELDTVKIKHYLTADPGLDEKSIEEKMQTFKNALKNAPMSSDLKPLDDKQLREIVIKSSKEMNGRYLLGLDDGIIGTGFAQFVLEGFVDEDLRRLMRTAIKRELLPIELSEKRDLFGISALPFKIGTVIFGILLGISVFFTIRLLIPSTVGHLVTRKDDKVQKVEIINFKKL